MGSEMCIRDRGSGFLRLSASKMLVKQYHVRYISKSRVCGIISGWLLKRKQHVYESQSVVVAPGKESRAIIVRN